MLGTEPYDIHTSCEEPVSQGLRSTPVVTMTFSDLSQQPAASTDDFSPWGRSRSVYAGLLTVGEKMCECRRSYFAEFA